MCTDGEWIITSSDGTTCANRGTITICGDEDVIVDTNSVNNSIDSWCGESDSDIVYADFIICVARYVVDTIRVLNSVTVVIEEYEVRDTARSPCSSVDGGIVFSCRESDECGSTSRISVRIIVDIIVETDIWISEDVVCWESREDEVVVAWCEIGKCVVPFLYSESEWIITCCLRKD